MNKILYDLVDQVLRPYSREDDEEIVGLDTTRLVVLTVQRNQPPAITAGQRIEPKDTIDLENHVLIRDWEIKSSTPQWPNSRAFMEAFTGAEKAAINLSQVPEIAATLATLYTWHDAMHANDPRVLGGLDLLITAGILTEQRKAEILATATAS